MRTGGRNPPALWFGVLRPPPFLCGLHCYCVGINHDARRGCAHHQTDTAMLAASSIFECDVQATERDIVTTLQEKRRSVLWKTPSLDEISSQSALVRPHRIFPRQSGKLRS